MRWLETISSRPQEHHAGDQPSNPESIKPDFNESTIDIFLGDAVSSLVDEQELAEKVLMHYKHSDEVDITAPDLNILEPDTSDRDESTGIDPDDKGVCRRSSDQQPRDCSQLVFD
jgi:hypothetical protein